LMVNLTGTQKLKDILANTWINKTWHS
jgi:hypothetical protein